MIFLFQVIHNPKLNCLADQNFDFPTYRVKRSATELNSPITSSRFPDAYVISLYSLFYFLPQGRIYIHIIMFPQLIESFITP